MGDDQTDEDAFRFLAGLASTFRIGSADTPTAAARRLPDVAAVHTLLDWLSRRREYSVPEVQPNNGATAPQGAEKESDSASDQGHPDSPTRTLPPQ
jgi:hypothetical protein